MSKPRPVVSLSASSALAARGVALLHDPVHNKGTAFTEAERELLGLRGLLPPRAQSQAEQVMRALENLRRKPNDLEKYIFLIALQDRNETLFYRLLVDNLEELMPIIYTPTVGQACQLYGHIFRRPRGMFVTAHDRGRVADVLGNWPHDDVRVVVVTDGERILGLGDLGADGMGIPIGKLSLYTACAGVDPTKCLPVTLDVGTENAALREDPLYIGLPEPRLRGPAYDELVEEFLAAVAARFPHAVIQLEDFANANAFRLLARYRDRYCLFDDDIQGTGSVVLAGLLAASRMAGSTLAEQRILFFGAGEAAIGIADLVSSSVAGAGTPIESARRRCWLVDSKGLVTAGRDGLAPHKLRFAHEHPPVADLLAAVEAIRPTVLVGASGVPGAFSRPVLEALEAGTDRPVVLALSNPTSKSECTAEEAYAWTGGRAIFASGSPFGPVVVGGRERHPGQANNAYIFPGVGLGAVVSDTARITDEMFAAAAEALAACVTGADFAIGRIYPSLGRVREVSVRIATAVADVAFERGFARRPRPADLEAAVRGAMFEPDYPVYG